MTEDTKQVFWKIVKLIETITPDNYEEYEIDNKKKYHCQSCKKVKNFIPQNEKIGLYFCEDCGEIYGNKHFQTLFSNTF